MKCELLGENIVDLLRFVVMFVFEGYISYLDTVLHTLIRCAYGWGMKYQVTNSQRLRENL